MRVLLVCALSTTIIAAQTPVRPAPGQNPPRDRPVRTRPADIPETEPRANGVIRGRVTSVDGDTVTTREWTPLEPGLVTKKVYESGTGQVLEDTIKGAAIEDLRLELVARA